MDEVVSRETEANAGETRSETLGGGAVQRRDKVKARQDQEVREWGLVRRIERRDLVRARTASRARVKEPYPMTGQELRQKLRRWKCHRIVGAAKIEAIDGTLLHLRVWEGGEMKQVLPFDVGVDWIDTRRPVVGGYFVQYKGGHTSYSPPKVFEEGYTPHESV